MATTKININATVKVKLTESWTLGYNRSSHFLPVEQVELDIDYQPDKCAGPADYGWKHGPMTAYLRAFYGKMEW